MPKLTLTGNVDDGVWVLGVMCFPCDKKLREQWLTVEQTCAAIHDKSNDEQIGIDVQTLRFILDTPSRSHLQAEYDDRLKRGVIAGNILLFIYVMNHFQLPEPSINKSIEYAQWYAAHKNVKYGDGTRLHGSLQYIRDCWNEFKPVAHLWAASQINREYPYCADNTQFHQTNLRQCLGIAAEIFRFATSYIPLRAKPKEPILSKEGAWLVPKDITPLGLPASASRPKTIENFLRNYRAK